MNRSIDSKKSLLYATKPLLLFLTKAVLVYSVLHYLYLGYVGLADPKGEYDFSRFFGSFNLILLITKSLVISSEFILDIFGYETISGTKTLRIPPSGGVLIEYACLGVELWIAFITLIATYPVSISDKWKWRAFYILAGIFLIHLLNVIRVTAITLSSYYNFKDIDLIHDQFNLIVYIVIFLGFLYWIKQTSDGTKSVEKRQEVPVVDSL